MKNLLGSLLVATGTVGAAITVLTGIESLLRPVGRQRTSRRRPVEVVQTTPEAVHSRVEADRVEARMPAPKTASERNFSIKRTKSEVGYVYWVLEGYGKYKCFELCDSWDEAVTQAKAKMAEIDAVDSAAQSVAASLPVPTSA